MTDIFIDKFRGIREQNPVCEVVSSGQMSAVLSQNVELEFSQNGDHVGIRTVKGDTLAFSLPDVMIYGFFESVQEGAAYYFVYGARQKENGEAEGVLWSVDLMKGEAEELKSGLQAKENCNGITIAQGFDDWFVFTNGADDYVACRMKDKTVQNLNAKDAEGRDIRGLCLESYDGRLVTNSQNRVHWSKVQDIFEWSEQTTGVLTNPAYQEFDRDITALSYYNGSLIAFTEDYSVYMTGNPADTSSFIRGGATGGGCSGFNAVIKFDNKLFYYDGKAKNIFAYYLIDVGQTRPTNGLANEVFSYFDDLNLYDLDKIRVAGLTGEGKSEIWLMLPARQEESRVLIYDYLKGEWLCRLMPACAGIYLVSGQIYAARGNGIYKQYAGETFGGEFKQADYTCSIINLGSDSNLKIPKMPLILTLDGAYNNRFYIDFKYDDDDKKIKTKRIEKINSDFFIWSLDEEETDPRRMWALDKNDEEHGFWVKADSRNVTVNSVVPLTFKQLQLRFYTMEEGDGFFIKRVELKRVKIKTKTVG